MIIEYPYIPEGKTIKYVNIDNPFMAGAKEYARERSLDSSMPTGAVLVKNSKIIARESNQTAFKNKKLLKLHKNGMCIRRVLGIKTGKKYWACPGCATHSNHAETRVIKKANELGQETGGSDMYLWGHWWCCKPCWDKIIQAGIRDVYLLENSHRLFDHSSKESIIGRQFD